MVEVVEHHQGLSPRRKKEVSMVVIHWDDQEAPLIKRREQYKRGQTLTQKLFKGLKPKHAKTINMQNMSRKNSSEPQEEMIGKMADQKVSNAVIIQKALKPSKNDKFRRILMDDNDLLPKNQSINLGCQKPVTTRASVITRTGIGLEPLISYP